MSEGRTSEGSASEGSKNPELRVPLRCEWTTSDGSECAACFSDVSTFASHVRDHYRRLFGSMKLACCWNGCDFMSKEGSALIQHILFHPFHSYLKLLGAEIQTKFQLPSCQIDEQYKNLVPSLQVALRCQWDGGKCVSEFDSVGDFFFHARKHVMMQDNRCCQCKWKGMNAFTVIGLQVHFFCTNDFHCFAVSNVCIVFPSLVSCVFFIGCVFLSCDAQWNLQ